MLVDREGRPVVAELGWRSARAMEWSLGSPTKSRSAGSKACQRAC